VQCKAVGVLGIAKHGRNPEKFTSTPVIPVRIVCFEQVPHGVVGKNGMKNGMKVI